MLIQPPFRPSSTIGPEQVPHGAPGPFGDHSHGAVGVVDRRAAQAQLLGVAGGPPAEPDALHGAVHHGGQAQDLLEVQPFGVPPGGGSLVDRGQAHRSTTVDWPGSICSPVARALAQRSAVATVPGLRQCSAVSVRTRSTTSPGVAGPSG